jgi:hypothetical protein
MITEMIERRGGAYVTSPAKIRANQRNARKSTGPRTRAGKATVARNALRHGLTLPVLADPTLAPEVVDVARAVEQSVIGAEADETGHDLACRIAEAMIDLRRVRLAKLPLVTRLDANPCDREAVMELSRLDRYEGRAFARRNRAIRVFVATARCAKIGRTKPTEKRQGFQGAASAPPVAAPAGCTGAGPARESAEQSQRGKANEFSKTNASHPNRRGTRLRGYRFAARSAYRSFSKYGMRVMRC